MLARKVWSGAQELFPRAAAPGDPCNNAKGCRAVAVGNGPSRAQVLAQLKLVPYRKLDLPSEVLALVCGGGERSKHVWFGWIQDKRRVGEIHAVECVERRHPELKMLVLGYVEVLIDTGIQGRECRSGESVSRTGQSRQCKGDVRLSSGWIGEQVRKQRVAATVYLSYVPGYVSGQRGR